MEMYIRNPTTVNCHVSGNNIEVDSKGVVPPSLSLEIHSCHIPLHGRYVVVCHDCSTFFPTSIPKEIDKITRSISKSQKVYPSTRVENTLR